MEGFRDQSRKKKNRRRRKLAAVELSDEDLACHDAVASTQEYSIGVDAWPEGYESTFEIDYTDTPYESDFDPVPGWCIDYDRDIEEGTYLMDIYSAYGTIPENVTKSFDAVDFDENLDALTWFINNVYWGDSFLDDIVAQFPLDDTTDYDECKDNISTEDAITFFELQGAVWKIVDDNSGIGTAWESLRDECIVDYLAALALQEGDGYIPDCDDEEEEIPLILVVDDDTTGEITHQVIISETKLSTLDLCDCLETIDIGDAESGAIFGDPHVKTWSGEHYDFHGVCDLVFIQNPDFGDGLGMDIQIRTVRSNQQYSSISTVAIRIGDEILEVGAHQNQMMEQIYYVNGKVGAALNTLSGYPITGSELNSKQREFTIVLNESEGEMISIKTFKDMLRVDVKNASKENFGTSIGMMGTFESGTKVGRDGITVLEDNNVFGQEWQVLPEEDMLFHEAREPQAPAQCIMPVTSSERRRLGDSSISIEEAERACSRVSQEDFDTCVFDVLALQDSEIAGAY